MLKSKVDGTSGSHAMVRRSFPTRCVHLSWHLSFSVVIVCLTKCCFVQPDIVLPIVWKATKSSWNIQTPGQFSTISFEVLVEWVWMPRYGSCTIYKIVLIACNENLNICSGNEGWQCAVYILDPTLTQLILYFNVCYLHYPLSYSTICSKWLSLGYKPCNPNSN